MGPDRASRHLGAATAGLKLREEVSPGHLLFALSFFDDADAERMPTMLRPCSWAAVKKTIRHWVTRAAR